MSEDVLRGKFSTAFVICFLVVAAFVSRFQVFIRPQPRSVDEIVYYNLGRQLTVNLANYNSIGIAKVLRAELKRDLPEYFTQPLFKHPPLFSLLVAGAVYFCGDDLASAEIVSLGFAVLLIPLVYLLGKLLFDRIVGLLAAFFLFLDPVSIMSSQKVWMETTLTFFTVLALYCFIYGIKNGKNRFFIYSGFATGLAALTKYPGILPIFVMMLYAATFKPQLYRQKTFLISLAIPVLMLLPWFYWNFRVYHGMVFVERHFMLHNFLFSQSRTIFILSLLLTFVVLSILYAQRFLKAHRQNLTRTPGEELLTPKARFYLATVFMIVFLNNIIMSLDLFHIPTNAWDSSIFAQANGGFYFGRLMEYSLVFFFAFAGFFIRFKAKDENAAFLKTSSLTILLFYIIYRSYQSRYILAAIPFLIILGVVTWRELWGHFAQHPHEPTRRVGRMILLAAVAYVICKTFFINYFLSFTNNMCYF